MKSKSERHKKTDIKIREPIFFKKLLTTYIDERKFELFLNWH